MVGNLLGIKPVLHVDDEGHLVNVSKVRGRRASLAALSDALGRSVLPGEKKVFISHGDCREDAELLAKMIEERYGMTAELISEVGPVIGAHSGPGTLALFFLGNKR
jgi:DegV family protein with EDD domain